MELNRGSSDTNMVHARTRYVFLLLCIFAGLLFTASLFFAYKAGCAGDLKTGSLGNLQEAMRYESYGFPCLLLGLAVSAYAAFIYGARQPGRAIAQSVGVFILLLALMIFSGMQLEVWGSQACL